MLCCLVVICWERADLLALVGDVYNFYNFPMWCPGSGEILQLLSIILRNRRQIHVHVNATKWLNIHYKTRKLSINEITVVIQFASVNIIVLGLTDPGFNLNRMHQLFCY